MHKQGLRKLFLQPIDAGFSRRYGCTVLESGLQREALELTLDPDPRIAFRSAAAVEHAFLTDKERFIPHTELILHCYLETGNPSAHRHLGKLVGMMLAGGTLNPSPGQAAEIAGRAFDRLIDPEGKCAVKTWSMEILFWLGAQIDWIDEQLEETVRFLMADGSPGIQHHGAKICRRIKKRRLRFRQAEISSHSRA